MVTVHQSKSPKRDASDDKQSTQPCKEGKAWGRRPLSVQKTFQPLCTNTRRPTHNQQDEECQVTLLLSLLPAPLWYNVIVLVRLSSIDQIDLFKIMFKVIMNYINRLALKILILQLSMSIAQFTGAVEYADYFSADE